jgi:RNA polymerase sigma-70 factor (ECF subfamily)
LQYEEVEPWVRAASTTDQRFRSLFDAHHRELHAYCLRRLPVEDANEAVSEIFLVALRRPDRIPEKGEALLWLYGVARNVVRNHQRSNWRRLNLAVRHQSMTAPHVDGPEVHLLRNEEQRSVSAAIDTLRSDDQELLRLKVWEGLSNEAVGAILGITDRAVEARYTRAIKKLSKILDGGSSAADRSPSSTVKGEVAG